MIYYPELSGNNTFAALDNLAANLAFDSFIIRRWCTFPIYSD